MIEAVNVSKIYKNKIVLDNFSIEINKGDFISITGESGRGKTTLLNILGLLEKPSTGNILVDGVKNPNKKQKMLIQRNLFGYVFQNYALIENETVKNNLNIALEYTKNKNKKEEMDKVLEQVNLEGFLNHKIYELSGGEQQRVALARVFLKDCSYIFADEPTGNLDQRNRDMIFDILKRLNTLGKTVIYATHDMQLANRANEQVNFN